MKLFVVVMFVMSSLVFAEDKVPPPAAPSGFGLGIFGDSPMDIDLTPVVPPKLSPPQASPSDLRMPGGSGPEGSEATKEQMPHDVKEETKPKNDQKYSEPAPLKTGDNATDDQNPSHERKRYVGPNEQPPAWYATPLVVFLGTIIGLGLAGYGVRLAWYQVFYAKKADEREERALGTERMSMVTGRAYVSVEGWKLDDLRDDEGRRELIFSLVNRGNAPATIIAVWANDHLEEKMPLPFHASKPKKEEFDTTLTGMKLYANVPLMLARYVPHGTAFRKEIESRRKTLYALVYVEYDDGFGHTQKESAFVKYSLTASGWDFTRVGGVKYNYST